MEQSIRMAKESSTSHKLPYHERISSNFLLRLLHDDSLSNSDGICKVTVLPPVLEVSLSIHPGFEATLVGLEIRAVEDINSLRLTVNFRVGLVEVVESVP